MPEWHHQSRTQNHPHRDKRDRNKEREYRSADERYREERSSEYGEERRHSNDKEKRTHRHPRPPAHEDADHQQHQEMYSDPPAYETTRRQALYNLRYSLTSRGICQIMEFFLNLLIIICAGVPYSNKGQYQDIANLGGLYYYYYGGAQAFTAQEAAKVKQLDESFYQLKLPPYIYSMACGGALMAYALAMFAIGIFRVPYRWPVVLLVEALLDGLIGLGYIPAIAFYFIKLQEIYSSTICKDREAMYNSKNNKGSECSLNGTDIAGGIFGVLGFISFLISAVLAVRAFRARLQRRKAEDNNL